MHGRVPASVSEDANSALLVGPRYRRLRREDLELIAYRHVRGASDGEIARELGVYRSSVRRARKRPAGLELIAAEQKREAKRAESQRYRDRKRQQRELAAHAIREAEEAAEIEPHVSGLGERGERRDPPPPSSTARLGVGGVPLFPNTLEGQYERLAYYEARKLNHLPHSLLDYHDVIHAERRRPSAGLGKDAPAAAAGRLPGSGSTL